MSDRRSILAIQATVRSTINQAPVIPKSRNLARRACGGQRLIDTMIMKVPGTSNYLHSVAQGSPPV